MKPSTKTLFALGCAYTMAAASSLAQIYTFDEFGNSTTAPSTAPPMSPGILQADPSGGLTVPVLVYTLPLLLVTGDVVLIEPGNSTGGQYSDVVRFWDPTGANLTQIIFYSDFSATDPADAPADTGLPVNLINPVFINEVGPEGNNGASYIPPAGEPGYTVEGLALQYNIISDVPEPSAITLASLGGGLLLLSLKRRHATTV
jgi:PEP-CTERM motif